MKPKKHNKKFIAFREFTDRVGALELFVTSIRKKASMDKCEVLNWYGIGGEGKSALLGKILRTIGELNNDIHSDNEIVSAKLNLDVQEYRSIEQALLSIRLQLGLSFGGSFPCFDTAFARYHVKTNPQIDIRNKFPELFKGENTLLNDTIELVKDLMEDTPGIGFLYKYSARLSARLKEWYKRRGSVVLRGIDTLEDDELLAKLPEFLGADLFDITEKQPNKRIFIGIDTYEALWRDTNTTDPLMGARHDEWVRTLVAYSPGVLYALFGRDKLQWETIDADWASSLDCHRLGALSEEDCHMFLAKVPMHELNIRERIVQSANGLPFYLDLQVQLYESLIGTNELDINLFGGTHADILLRFLDHLPTNEHKMVRLASYPNSLSEELLLDMFKEHGGGINNLNWDWFTRQSFISKNESNVYAMHGLMRDALQTLESKERPKVAEEIHRFLFDYYDKKLKGLVVTDLTKEHDVQMSNALFHRLRFEAETFFEWFNERNNVFIDGCRSKNLERSYRTILSYQKKSVQFGHQESTLHLKGALAAQLGQLGYFREAENMYRAILKECLEDDKLGHKHPDTLLYRHCLSDILKELGRYHEAESELLTVLDIQNHSSEIGEEHRDTLVTRGALASLLGEQGDYKMAEAEYRVINKIQMALSDGKSDLSEHSSIRHNIAHQMGNQGRYKEAEAEFRAIWELHRKSPIYGEMHIETLKARLNLAQQIGLQGRSKEAEIEFKTCLELLRHPDYLGEVHPFTLNTRYCLAEQISSQGKFKSAENEFRAIYEVQKQPGFLGPIHPHTLATRMNIALQISYQGNHKKAESELNAIWQIKRRPDILGENHPDTLATRYNLAQQISNQGNHEKALSEYFTIYELLSNPNSLGCEHPKTMATRQSIAIELSNLGRFEEAEKEFRAALMMYEQHMSFGGSHTETLRCRYEMAMQIAKQGRYKEAEREFSSVWDVEKRPDVNGEGHPDTLRTSFWIAKMCHKTGDIDKRDKLLDGLEEKMLANHEEDHKYIVELRTFVTEIRRR